ncbi:hypothetical protein BC829DRAFT_458185 [Chytridium lagenaria]|nr:hypothetical protein BC829DRAFT_458185 [Chytridium lagenaria]
MASPTKYNKSGLTAGPSLKLYTLWVHDERFSKQDVVINPEWFGSVERGDLLELYHPRVEMGKNDSETGKGKRLIVQVTAIDPDISTKQPQLQISITQSIAATFDLLPRTTVAVRKVEKSTISADFMELSFRDQYIGRADMWKLKTSLNNTCIHVGKKVTSLGVRAQVKELVTGGRSVPCAYITENTRTIYRSESAKYFIFIQMSKEMWEFDDDGELYFEKWRLMGFCLNSLTVGRGLEQTTLFPSCFSHGLSFKEAYGNIGEDNGESPICIDAFGRYYRDFYRVVVDWETRSDWSSVLIPLKKEFIVFPKARSSEIQ